MNKTIIVLMTIAALTPLLAKDKGRKLTAEEIVAVDAFIEPMSDPNSIRKVEQEPDIHHTNRRRCEQMQTLQGWYNMVKAGSVKCQRRVDGEYVEDTATEADVNLILAFDRPWNNDPNYIEDILNKERCPLDGHLYDTGDPNEA